MTRPAGCRPRCHRGERNAKRTDRPLYQPDVARPHRALDAGGDRAAVPCRGARIRRGDEVAPIPGDQPDGQGAGHCPRRRGGDRVRRHLRLAGRCLPRSRAGAGAWRSAARPVLPLAVLRRRSAGGGGHRQVAGPAGAGGEVGHGRLRQLRADGRRAGDGRRRRRAVAAGRTLQRRRRLCRQPGGVGPAVRQLAGAPGLRRVRRPPAGA